MPTFTYGRIMQTKACGPGFCHLDRRIWCRTQQDVNNPLGIGGTALHEWALGTRTIQKRLLGKVDGATGPDDDFAARSFENIGAWILGRIVIGLFVGLARR